MQSVRHWFEVTANVWLIAFFAYYLLGIIFGFITVFISRRSDRGFERLARIFEMGLMLPIILPALAVGWVLVKMLTVPVGYPIIGLIWLWQKIFKQTAGHHEVR